jgi:hypothetical protein
MQRFTFVLAALIAVFSTPAHSKHHRHHYHRHYSLQQGSQETYLAHPTGCPSRAFCGCGAAADLGILDRSLWLAAAWYKFPRSHPAPNTVAVRSHHVFVLKQHMGGSNWLVADYNSGRGLSRLHIRSIGGYTIVSPSPSWQTYDYGYARYAHRQHHRRHYA